MTVLSQVISQKLVLPKIGKVSLRKFLLLNVAFIAFSLMFYMFQNNEMVRNTYLTKDMEGKISKISQENAFLEKNILKSNSLSFIETSAQKLNFEKVGEIKYIQIMDNKVVRAK